MKVNGMVTCFNTVPPTSYLFYRLVLALKNINWHFKNMVRFQLQLKRQKKRNEWFVIFEEIKHQNITTTHLLQPVNNNDISGNKYKILQ